MIRNLKNRKKKGFTLIEIIAVIAIIAILAAVLVPKVMGYMREAKKTGVIDEARSVVSAAKSIELRKGGVALAGTETVSTIETKSGGLVKASELKKLGANTGAIGSVTLDTCQKIVDAENYTFNVDDKGILSGTPTTN
ncbi:prepilin-type N-terminal cleavage/methylation domain-containing protein [Clostridium paraputrificum]|uniref:prepilin-type N-terminal cleavage/methylation domain-containing protein n=1 Tax=Clostridium paraputrificum TaxID=29363 RepID=UPI003D3545A1